MKKFNIVKVDPDCFKSEILQLWDAYLPGTPHERFEWMKHNAAGRPDWFLAFEENSDTVAGMISIMPKRFDLQGRICRTGIVGDFAVKKEYQVFGPSLSLLKTVIGQHEKLNYDFLYTLPNSNAAKVCTRAGFNAIAVTERYVKVLRPGRKIARYLPKAIAVPVAALFDLGYRIISKETYARSKLSVMEIEDASQFKIAYIIEPGSKESSKGAQDQPYTEWRYFRNPVCQFNASLYQESRSGRFVGKIIYTVNNSRIYIYDLWTSGMEYFSPVLASFFRDRRKERYESISIRTIEETEMSYRFERIGFVSRNEKIPILYAGKKENLPEQWSFFDGDRNI